METGESGPGEPVSSNGSVSLAFVGGTPEYALHVSEVLQGKSLRATFFVNPPAVLADVRTWRSVADAGHEIANASLLGVTDDGRIPNWTLRMVEQDLHMTDEFLRDLFGERYFRAFIVPGRHLECSNGNYRPLIDREFPWVVGADIGPNGARFDAHDICTFDGPTYLREKMEPNGEWHVLRFDEANPKLLDLLGNDTGPVAPLVETAAYRLALRSSVSR